MRMIATSCFSHCTFAICAAARSEPAKPRERIMWMILIGARERAPSSSTAFVHVLCLCKDVRRLVAARSVAEFPGDRGVRHDRQPVVTVDERIDDAGALILEEVQIAAAEIVAIRGVRGL